MNLACGGCVKKTANGASDCSMDLVLPLGALVARAASKHATKSFALFL
jgi:hypothetical protein